MNQTLVNQLKQWNGQSKQYLLDLYNSHVTLPFFFKDLIEIFLNHSNLQSAVTWLIKHHYDCKNQLSPELTECLLTYIDTLIDWQAKLHILQLIPQFKLTESSVLKVDDFSRRCLKDENKFVRAWAYSALYEVSKYIPESKNELQHLCERALDVESAAVKVRARQTLANLRKA